MIAGNCNPHRITTHHATRTWRIGRPDHVIDYTELYPPTFRPDRQDHSMHNLKKGFRRSTGSPVIKTRTTSRQGREREQHRASANGVPRYFQGVKVNYNRHINIFEIRSDRARSRRFRKRSDRQSESIKSTVCRRSEDRKVFGLRFDRGFSMPSLCFV